MLKYENSKVRQIDRKILEELRKNLEIRVSNFDIISKTETEKVISIIEEKKRGIFLLFQGDFSLNEYNINEKIPKQKRELSFYDRIANNVILRRIEKIFNKLRDLEAQDYRATSVCADRQFFIKKVILENIQTSFIESCVNGIER